MSPFMIDKTIKGFAEEMKNLAKNEIWYFDHRVSTM